MNERLQYLYMQFRLGKASPEELQELLEYLDQSNENEALGTFLFDRWQQAAAGTSPLNRNTIDTLADRLTGRLPAGQPHRIGWKVLVAASVLAVVSTLAYRFWPVAEKPVTVALKENNPVSDILPARKAARLTLDDGTVKYIDSLPEGWALSQGSAGVQRNGQVLSYTEKQQGEIPGKQVRFNTVSTAMGETFPALQLADGTKVWLNAGSSIRFPVSFNGQTTREVEITGELYFEVAKDKARPFLVRTADDTISVLGTHFNVNHYTGESHHSTTLLEGSVAVQRGGKQFLLKPGDAAVATPGSLLRVVRADTAQAVAWRDNLFYFDHTDIASAMRQVARWYDLEIECTGNGQRTITGQLPRSVPAATLLKALELSGNIKYKIEGRYVKITI